MMVEFQGAWRQSGATLFVGLIMLLLLTLLGISAIQMGATHTQILGNTQFRNEVEAAANFALDQVANDPDFTANYNNTTLNVNVGQANYDVTISRPNCLRYRTIRQNELVAIDAGSGRVTVLPADQPCVQDQTALGSLNITRTNANTLSGNSLCATTLWGVQGQAADPSGSTSTGTRATMQQGLEMRMDIPRAITFCN
jgi:hypothetical protein